MQRVCRCEGVCMLSHEVGYVGTKSLILRKVGNWAEVLARRGMDGLATVIGMDSVCGVFSEHFSVSSVHRRCWNISSVIFVLMDDLDGR